MKINFRAKGVIVTAKQKALTNEVVLKYMGSGIIKKVIYVKNRLINIVF